VKLVGHTGEALRRIVGEVAEINELVTEIAASSHEQSTGLAEVNTAVNQMDQVTQQNAAMVEQSTAASHALANEAAALSRLVGQFRIGEATAPAAAAAVPAPSVAPVPRSAAPVQASSPAPAPVPRPAARPAPRTFGSAAVALAPGAEDDWTEF